MTGQMKNPNSYPTVVTNPTRYTGGKNASVKASTNPTKYTGGYNKATCDVPNAKLIKK